MKMSKWYDVFNMYNLCMRQHIRNLFRNENYAKTQTGLYWLIPLFSDAYVVNGHEIKNLIYNNTIWKG